MNLCMNFMLLEVVSPVCSFISYSWFIFYRQGACANLLVESDTSTT